jgi:serine/threonine-protein kinase RsbW
MNPLTAAPAEARTQAEVRTFGGTADQVRCARRFVATAMTGRASAGDAAICVSEIATNAVLHSDSGRPGGSFTVHVMIDAAVTRIEITDQGGGWNAVRPQADSSRPSGRGLTIVAALATDWGIHGDNSARTVWFEI